VTNGDVDRSFRRSLTGAILASALLTGLLVYGTIIAMGETSDAQPAPTPARTFTLDVLEPGAPTGELAAVVEDAGQNGKITLEELRGTPVVLNFWASWCEYCEQETPMMQKASQQAAEDGVLFLGVDTDDLDDEARAFLNKHGVTYPTVSDPDSAVADDYGVQSIPTTFFIDADGQIVDQVIGAPDPETLDAGIRAIRDDF
jgi:cytochrome c biogenesis protein CcmG/thiol:disulfide interchange protein DsbE